MKFIKYLSEEKTDLKEKIIEFIVKNPNPKDDDFHKFAEKIGVKPDELESVAYSAITDFWANGRYNEKGKNIKFDEKELAAGIKVEMEHTSNKIMAERIAKDHLTEINDYYTRLIKMEKDAGIKD
ncbi:MAG: DUF5661 family protein [Methanogenium sp.]|jgi:hypothetical protein